MRSASVFVLIFTGLIAGVPAGPAPVATAKMQWQQLSPGLELGEYVPAQKSEIGNSKITVLRIDPKHYSFRLLTAAEHQDQRKTAAQWCQQHKLVACINAGMYQPDGQNVGYMRKNGGTPLTRSGFCP